MNKAEWVSIDSSRTSGIELRHLPANCIRYLFCGTHCRYTYSAIRTYVFRLGPGTRGGNGNGHPQMDARSRNGEFVMWMYQGTPIYIQSIQEESCQGGFDMKHLGTQGTRQHEISTKKQLNCAVAQVAASGIPT